MNARLVGRMRFTRAGVGQRRGRAGQRSFPSRRGHCRPLSPTGFFRLNSFAAAPVTNPPSITNSEPVLKLDLSDTRNSASFVTSSASPARPIGVRSIKAFTRVCRPRKNGVSIAPGARLGSASLESVKCQRFENIGAKTKRPRSGQSLAAAISFRGANGSRLEL